MVNFGGKMIKTKFLFAVSFVALLVVNNSYAVDATDLVPDAQRVDVGTAEDPNYLGDEMEIPQSLVEYMASHPWDGYTTTGIAGVTYVNKAVGAAGNAAQWAENRAAAAADSAIVAQVAAEDAAASADDANKAVATKFDNTFKDISNAIVTTDEDGNVAPVAISDEGTGAFVTDVTVGDNGAVTLTRADVTMPTATASVAGISMLGTIPSGADKAGTATIWVE